MKNEEAVRWIEELLKQTIPTYPSISGPCYETEPTAQWIAEAGSALQAIFPATHRIMRDWDRTIDGASKSNGLGNPSNFERLRANARAALEVLRRGGLTTLTATVRAETVHEVLEQAGVHLLKDEFVAATVLAGGALETHLRHLCDANAITWNHDGSINKYNDAIAQARNTGTHDIYDVSTGHAIKGWGAKRNDAAHTPTTFAVTAPEVRLMIEGIRLFMQKTS